VPVESVGVEVRGGRHVGILQVEATEFAGLEPAVIADGLEKKVRLVMAGVEGRATVVIEANVTDARGVGSPTLAVAKRVNVLSPLRDLDNDPAIGTNTQEVAGDRGPVNAPGTLSAAVNVEERDQSSNS
jgi:hypothetical protein